MTLVATSTFYTPEGLLALCDDNAYELVNGRLVERNIGAWSSYVAGRLFFLLNEANERHPRGHVFSAGASYQCFRNVPANVRRADASFVRFGRLADETIPVGHITIAPDLAVEVISPTDLVEEVDQRVTEFLDAGVELVWVIHSRAKTVHVYRPGRHGAILRANDELSCDDLIPDFRYLVSKLFEVRTPIM